MKRDFEEFHRQKPEIENVLSTQHYFIYKASKKIQADFKELSKGFSTLNNKYHQSLDFLKISSHLNKEQPKPLFLVKIEKLVHQIGFFEDRHEKTDLQNIKKDKNNDDFNFDHNNIPLKEKTQKIQNLLKDMDDLENNQTMLYQESTILINPSDLEKIFKDDVNYLKI